MEKKFLIFLIGFSNYLLSQSNCLVISGTYIKMNGGVVSSPLYLVINQASNSGVSRLSSGHIISESQYNLVKWNASSTTGNYIFPFGYGTSSYIPLDVNKLSTNNTSIISSTWSTAINNIPYANISSVPPVSSFNNSIFGADPNLAVIDRWWDIRTTSTTSANIVFRYRGVENTTSPSPTLGFYGQPWLGSVWGTYQGTGNGVLTGVGSVSVTNTTNFTPWVLVSSLSVLPIELIDFDAVSCLDEVCLSWQTESEIDFRYFLVEHSTDGLTWKEIANVAGSSINSISKQSYTAKHSNPLNGLNYYRLKMVSYDGSFIYSDVKSVEFDNVFSFSIYPIPSVNQLTIKYSSALFNDDFFIYDSLGSLIMKGKLDDMSGRLNLNFNSSSGVYFINTTHSKKYQKIIKENQL